MKTKLTILALAGLCAGPVLAVTEAEAMDLAKKNGCLACHSLDKKMVGPAWKDVGRKYASESGAAEQLAVKVKKGSKGVWGQIPMPPNATVKDADVKTLVAFVLSLK